MFAELLCLKPSEMGGIGVKPVSSQVWALEVQPSVGWNQRTFDPPLHFERLRLLGSQGLGAGDP